MAIKNRLRKTIGNAGEKIQEEFENAKEKFSDVEDSAVRYIKKNPVKSVAIAAGIGAIIGAGLYLGMESMVKSRMRKQSFWEKYNPLNIL